ncbi:NAD(P)/FAD-dependent oxidoreductase [Isoptericola sp. NPDC057653]|uniref:FAD/NAD(P)-dependent oxidoreductase n=1 Tax=Isoptericola sp. NPDC057653 TaxID=3346195 RepID=UPI0036A6E476
MSRRTVVVVGAGPAGLSAARAAARAGADVTLLDASDQVGGQFWRHRVLPGGGTAPDEPTFHHGWGTFTSLRDVVASHPRVTLLTSAQVWALERLDDGVRLRVLVGPADSRDREHLTLTPDALVLATGAHDRTLPFPGWQLPGVTTAGAAQALAKAERVAVGERVVVAGAGPFLLPVATSLLRTGARVLSVHEAATPASLARGWGARPAGLLGAAHKLGELGGYAGALARHRVAYRLGEAVVAARGDGRVEEVTVSRVDARWAPVPGTERTVAADAVCVSHGFTPRLELAVAAACAISPDRFVVVDERQRTSAAGVWAAGEVTGIGGAEAALAEGWVAGHHAASGAPDDAALVRAVRRRDRSGDFARRLEAAHGIRRGWTAWLRDDTLVCRCEEVDAGTLRAAARATDSTDLRSVRLTSRAGLGPCQARVCGRTVAELVGATGPAAAGCGATSGFPPESPPAVPDRRPLVVPVRLGDLATLPDDLTRPDPT